MSSAAPPSLLTWRPRKRPLAAEAEVEVRLSVPASELWAAVLAPVSAFFAASARAEHERCLLRPLLDTVTDPLDLQHAASADPSASFGVELRCEGDERLRRVQEMLDAFWVERHDTQKLWHWHIIAACLPHIYKRDWSRARNRVLKSMGIDRLRSEVLVMTSRRAGKTWSIAMFVASVLLCVPGLRVVVISTGGRASGKLMKASACAGGHGRVLKSGRTGSDSLHPSNSGRRAPHLWPDGRSPVH